MQEKIKKLKQKELFRVLLGPSINVIAILLFVAVLIYIGVKFSPDEELADLLMSTIPLGIILLTLSTIIWIIVKQYAPFPFKKNLQVDIYAEGVVFKYCVPNKKANYANHVKVIVWGIEEFMYASAVKHYEAGQKIRVGYNSQVPRVCVIIDE